LAICARDAAYHQGTVWGWLIGPFIDAWLRVHAGDTATARHFLDGFEAHVADAGVGTISEVFDAEAPYRPRGCIAQAWSVAEVLRCLVKTASSGDVTRSKLPANGAADPESVLAADRESCGLTFSSPCAGTGQR
jgi:glycogen debranching enzyme